MGPQGLLAQIQDAAGEAYQYTYEGNGLLQTTTTPKGGQYQYTFDGSGRLLEDVDPVGGGATYSNSLTATGNVGTRTSAMGLTSSFELDQPASAVSTQIVTDPSGLKGTTVRGTDGSVTTTDPDGTVTTLTVAPDPRFGMESPVAATTTITTPSGLVATTSTNRTVSLASASNLLSLQTETQQTTLNGNAWTTVFNAAAGTSTVTSPAGRTTTTTIDSAGRATQIAVPGVAPVTFGYDSHGHPTSMAAGSIALTYSYDALGYPASRTDGLGNTLSFLNDSVGRMTQLTKPDGRTLGFAYDAAGQLASVTLPSHQSHEFSYSTVDLLTSNAPPALGTGTWSTGYQYDRDRRTTLLTRPDGATVTSGYDSAGRLSAVTYPQGTLSTTYSPATGHVATRVSPNGETLTYGYDGFLRTAFVWSGPVAGSLTLGYDPNFLVTSQKVNTSNAMVLGYDADNLLTQGGALTLTRDPQNGRVTGTALGSMTDAYTYDPSTGLLSSYVASYGGTTLYSESLLRDAVGRIQPTTETMDGAAHVYAYTYDATGRLTDVTKDGTAISHYGYDADDNRTTFTGPNGTVSPTYDAQDRLLTYGSASYTYTATGELTSKTVGTAVTSYTYDALGNLLNAGLPNGTNISYVVDGERRRVGKQVSGTLTQGFLYQDALNVVAQLDGSGNVVAQFVFGSKPNVPDYYTTASGTFRIVSDQLGSPRLVVNTSSGAVVEEIDYSEFGVVTNDTNPGLIPFGFAGGLYDKDTGLTRFGARDYDASTGRWTSKDPIRFGGGQMNLYGYLGNDPINHRDADGQGPWAVLAVGAACEAYAVYQAATTFKQLNDLIKQITALKKTRENDQTTMVCSGDPNSGISGEEAQQAEDEASAIQQEILRLTQQYATQQAEGEASFGLTEAACAAAMAAALVAPTP